MHRCSALATVVVVSQLGINVVQSFSWRPLANWANPVPVEKFVDRQMHHASSTSIEANQEIHERSDQLNPKSEARRRRVRKGVHRRARRIARVRRRYLRQATIDSIKCSGKNIVPNLNASVVEEVEESPFRGSGNSSLLSSTGTKEHAVALRDSPAKRKRLIASRRGLGLWHSIVGPKSLLEVHSVDRLKKLVDCEGYRLEELSVLTSVGASATLNNEREVSSNHGGCEDGVEAHDNNMRHPVVQAVLDRAAAGTVPSMHGDGRRIGLAIEVRDTAPQMILVQAIQHTNSRFLPVSIAFCFSTGISAGICHVPPLGRHNELVRASHFDFQLGRFFVFEDEGSVMSY